MFQNAEMSFNFGGKPFKFPPVMGFIGFDQADGKNLVQNSKSGGTTERKLIANAPQAIIIEVRILRFWCRM